jgi:hypothetical protein
MEKNFKASVLFSSIFVFGKGAEENNWKHNQQSKDITVSLSSFFLILPIKSEWARQSFFKVKKDNCSLATTTPLLTPCLHIP